MFNSIQVQKVDGSSKMEDTVELYETPRDIMAEGKRLSHLDKSKQ